MTKEEALDLALKALEKSLPRLAPYGEQDWLDSRAAITAIKQARSAPTVQEPVWIQPDHLQKAQKAPFLCRVEPHKRDDFVPLYTAPPAQPAPVQEPVAQSLIDALTHAVEIAEAKRPGTWDDLLQYCALLATPPAQPAPTVQEPVAWIHVMDNTEGIKANGKGIVSITQKRKHPFGKPGVDFSKSYPVTSTPLYTTPPAAPVQKPVGRVCFEGDEVVWTDEPPESGTLLYTTPPAAQPAPASWMEMVTANLVREGVGKHKARELAEHFYSLAQRQWVSLTNEERLALEYTPQGVKRSPIQMSFATEDKLKEKNNG